MPEVVENTIIIGSGPAGLTAAIYTARANLNPLVFEGLQPGGQLTITTEVENYPGFVDGIQGPELMDIMRKQAERFGSRHVYEFVDKIDVSERPFKVWVGGNLHLAHSLIIATGASARYLGLEDEEKFHGRGLSACATCDGFFFRDKEIMVVGGGDSAMEEGNFLTRFAKKVSLVHRRDAFRASKIMQDRLLANPKVEVLWNKTITKYIGDKDGQLTGVRLLDTVTGEEADVPTEGVFVAIGHTPNTGFLAGQLATDDSGYLLVTEHTRTSVDGVFAAGDVADTRYRQAVTAAGNGCQAAIDVEKWLEEHVHG
ncbi:MAG: thioredoxin-disulfide reductase [Deltaproteobacteria bacterium HGW-Deltaproteobacteria-14]|jgi:thioredoxin reductase (NADPH)|nr:MAG: thioredoxin-disulfide reductase [Deltaproteobacteria bacterium HGW-Deltaproteobacteria-14]